MRTINLLLIAAAFLALTGLFLKPWFGPDLMSVKVTPGEGTVHFEESAGVQGQDVRSTGIDVDSPPHLNISKSVSDKVFWRRGDTRGPQNTTVSIHVSGEGNPATDFNSQDVVFTIDCSDSMNSADNEWTRRDAAKSYVEELIPPDRAAVISFSNTAKLMGGHHLSSDHSRVIRDLYNLTNQGETNFKAAMELTNREFIDHGDENNSWICILLTDGKPNPPSTNITSDILNTAINNKITVYTIGLYNSAGSPTLINEELLRWIAKKTGGEYFIAESADDLMPIYEDIAMRFRNYTAGYDPDITDGEPMVRDVLPNDFHFDNDSFSMYPDMKYTNGEGMTVLEWNISKISIGEAITISYNVSCDMKGNVYLHPYEVPRVLYYLGGVRYEVFFPPISLWVLTSFETGVPLPPPPAPPPPPLPPPPPGGYPIPVTTPASPTVIPLTTPTGLPAAASPVIFPVEYLVGGFIGLGILERIKLKKRLLSKQKVAVGT